MTEHHSIVPHDAWIEARQQLLAKEKAFNRLRDELSRQRRELPWEKIEKNYSFEGPRGKETMEVITALSGFVCGPWNCALTIT